MGLLDGKTAIVTGAARGIGKAIALKFASEGANIAFTDLVIDENAENTAKEIEAMGVKAKGYASNAANFEDTAKVVEAIHADFGRIDILVNNAGVVLSNDQLIVDTDEDEFDRVVDTDYKAVFFLSKRVAKIMIEQEQGNIINLASVVARVASTRMAAYASAKAAVLQLTRCMAFEWARFNIRVNCICPGYIDTNMTQTTLNKPRAYEAITHPIPHNRKVGDPMDIAAAALFLACDCSDMVNGTPLYVDGARSIW